jgi:hypothetical protein
MNITERTAKPDFTDIIEDSKKKIADLERSDFIERISNRSKVMIMGTAAGINCFAKAHGGGGYNFAGTPKEAIKFRSQSIAEAQRDAIMKSNPDSPELTIMGLGDAFRSYLKGIKEMLPTFEAMQAKMDEQQS